MDVTEVSIPRPGVIERVPVSDLPSVEGREVTVWFPEAVEYAPYTIDELDSLGGRAPLPGVRGTYVRGFVATSEVFVDPLTRETLVRVAERHGYEAWLRSPTHTRTSRPRSRIMPDRYVFAEIDPDLP